MFAYDPITYNIIFSSTTPSKKQNYIASGEWFGSLIWTGAVGLIVGGPVGLAAGVTVGGIMAYEFEKHMWTKVLEVVKKESEKQPTVDSIDRYYHSN